MRALSHHFLPPRNRRRLLAVIVVLVAAGMAPARAAVTDPCKVHPTHVVNPGCARELTNPPVELPNLVPDVDGLFIFPALSWDPVTEAWVEGEPVLWFGTHAQNLGDVPLDLLFEGMEDADTATAAQCVKWTATRVCRERRPVGGFEWHAEHSHFHFTEFANYELRSLTPEGAVDYSAGGLLRSSEKVSFCLMDTQQVDPEASPTPFYASCQPGYQGVSPGWTDIYDGSIPGQQFDLTGIADGSYAIVVDMDYGNRLFETSDDDNVVEAFIEIAGDRTTAAVVARAYP